MKYNGLRLSCYASMLAASLSGLLPSATASTVEPPWSPKLSLENSIKHSQQPTLSVGLREAAQPFSYLSAKRADEAILPSYGGYMVEICRRVLTEMTATGPFENYKVVPVPVGSSDRFDALKTGKVDLLCGPDSITLSRLQHFNASYPLFLSGVTYYSAASQHFPQTGSCQPIIGLLADTTAETEGLLAIAKSNVLQRFDNPVEQFLAQRAQQSISALSAYHGFRRKIELALGHLEPTSGARGKSPPEIESITKPGDCNEGYNPGPVLFYEDHSTGLADLCAGHILYYIGDSDIIRTKLADFPSCKPVKARQTLTREAYGIFFRRSKDDVDNSVIDAGLLYSEFSNVLIRKMQDAENLLEYEFQRAFPDDEQSPDLQEFFRAFQYATNY